MEYRENQIREGIKLHTIETDKFKTNLMSVFLTTKISRENVTKNAVISAILRRGSKSIPTQEQISKDLEEMYGASFDCGLDKIGDNQVIKFYMETVNDNFLPHNGENLLITSMEKLLEIVFNPYIEKNGFKEEYVEQEKNNIKQRIEGKKDNKARYALDRCIEEMYKNKPYGLFKFGFIEDLEKIDGKSLYEDYKKLISECKIDIFVSGMLDSNIQNIIKENENIKTLKSRIPNYVISNVTKKEPTEEKVVQESMDVSQGKIVVGMDVNLENDDLKYNILIYNSILGGSANSKMFQNVREKEHLAYVASSSYLRQKNNIFINCGIEIENYEKALNLIKIQIDDMKKGEFTDEDVENAKKGIIAMITTIDDEQDTQITYYFGQELSNNKVTVEEYKNRIQNVTRQDVINVANSVNINTIYFLKD